MNAKLEPIRVSRAYTQLHQGKTGLYYGHCRWCLVISISLAWLLVTANFELAPIVAAAVYVIAHFPAKWYALHTHSKHASP